MPHLLTCTLLVLLGADARAIAPSHEPAPGGATAARPAGSPCPPGHVPAPQIAPRDGTILCERVIGDASLRAGGAPTVAAPSAPLAMRPLTPPQARPPDRLGAPPERARASAAGIVLELRSEFGFEPLIEVEFSNDRRVSLHANDGLAVAAGVSFLPLARGRLATRASVGFKVARLRADNGRALFTAFPVDLMEAVYLGPLRLGAGASVLVAPRLGGDGILDGARVTFDPAPGAVADLEWLVAPRARTGIGLRGSWYRFSANGVVQGAPSIGLVIRADLDVTGR